MKKIYACLIVSCFSTALIGQAIAFAPTVEKSTEAVALHEYELVEVDIAIFRQQLNGVPLENEGGRSRFSFELPTPEGKFLEFWLEDSPVMQPPLAAQYPQFKSYRVHGPHGTGRMAVSPQGITAAIMGPRGEYFINRRAEEDPLNYLVYYTNAVDYGSGLLDLPPVACGWDPAEAEEEAILRDLSPNNTFGSARSSQNTLGLRVYDLALSCTGEFAAIKGGTPEGVLNAYNEALTVLNGLLEREVGVRFMLIPQNNFLIFLNADTDPYVNANSGGGLLDQIKPAIEAVGISSNDYDLAHLFTAGCTDVGGVVSGRACALNKERGVTCNRNNNIAAVARGTLAHEIAHQFTVGHSWSNCPPNQGQLADLSAFEPGGGVTIMSYARACDDQSYSNRFPYYHVGSLDEFISYSHGFATSSGCATVLAPNNTEPEITVDYEDGFYIPISTPFELRGEATDADGDELIYNWEQYDLGPVSPLGLPAGNAPLFRSYPPDSESNTRIFPRQDLLLNNLSSNVEVLPTYSRNLTFRLTARDNNPNVGASVWKQVNFFSTEEAGPFVLTSANSDTVVWERGEYREVTWDVANTDKAPVNCPRVDILLSKDGGFTYPIALAKGTPNTGRAFITVPTNLDGNTFRLKVAASDNIFFDISDANFSIGPPSTPTFTIVPTPLYQQVCPPTTLIFDFATSSILDFTAPIQLELISDLPNGAVASFTDDELSPGETSQLMVDFNGINPDSLFEITVRAIAAGADTAYRTIYLDMVNNDFSTLSLTTPVEGTQGISLSTPFAWEASPNADDYDIQISTDPSFPADRIFDSATGLTQTTFDQNIFFETNLVYYWRVRANNKCGPSPWLDPASFRTINVQCLTYEATDTPISLPGSGGGYTRTSTIFIDEVTEITDVNIPSIKLNYQVVRNLTLTLVSPSGTRVKLYDQNCFGTQNFDIGFDDDAPNDVLCPPDDKRVFRPTEALSAFIGEDAFGTWTLEITVTDPGGTAGGLDSWDLEFCGNLNAVAPRLVTNEVSECPPDAGTDITGLLLRAEDDKFGPADVSYRLVRSPLGGTLRLGDQEISAGMTFTQQDLNAAQLHYRNTNPAIDMDDFSFVVENPDGGYIPINYHSIRIFEGAISSAEENESVLGQLEVFPNPADQEVFLRWSVPTETDLPLEILDVSGRRLISQRVPRTLTNYRLDISQLPSGVYFLRIGQVGRRILKR